MSITRRKVFQLVGESNYQDALRRARPGERLTLTPEPTNLFDAGAIYLATSDGSKLGYLPRDDAAAFSAVIHRARAVKLHRLTGGLPDYPNIGCEITVAWDDRPEHPHRDLDPEQRAFIRGPVRAASKEGWLVGIIKRLLKR